MKLKHTTWLGSLALAIAAVPVSGQLQAQPSARVLEEIIVTSRRRAETAQSVPLAVTALTGSLLDRNNIVSVEDLRTQVPSLTIVPGAGANRSVPTFAIRGLSQQELTVFSDPAVMVYYNDMAIPRSQGINQTLYDIEAVEVLKGPQGTLFGRNVVGGAISIRPNMPTDEFDANIGTTVGSHERINTKFMLNTPLTDWAQFRIAGATTRSEGWFKDVLLDDYINNEDSKALRVSLALQPTDKLDSVFTYSRYLQNDGGTGSFVKFLNPNHPALVPRYTGNLSPAAMLAQQQSLGSRKTASGVRQYARISTWDLMNTTTYELSDSLTLKNILGYRELSANFNDDTDGTPVAILQINRVADFEQLSQELQLIGTTEKMDWIVGLYYFREEGSNDDASVTFGPQSTPYPHGVPREFPAWATTFPVGENTSTAIFGQTTYKLDNLLEGLSATVGLRYNEDEREAGLRNRTQSACRLRTNAGVALPLSQCRYDDGKTFREYTWNVGLEYQWSDDVMYYLAHRRGYRTGVFSPRADTPTAFATTADPEIVDDIEFGAKADWGFANGMSLRTNMALYYAKYDDIQRLITDPTTIPVSTVAANAGDARIMGGELEFTFLPTANVELSGFVSYTDAEFKEFADPFSGADLSGNPFARAPEWIGSISGRYTLPLDAAVGDVYVQANYWYHGEYSANDTVSPNTAMSSFSLINGRIGWDSVYGTPLDLGIWVKNAADKKYDFSVLTLETALGFASSTPGDPRTWGLDLTYRFGAGAK